MSKQKKMPAKTIEGRENQLINLAVNEAEQRLLNGTASSQIIVTLLKLATTKAQLEIEKTRADIALQNAKEQELKNKATSEDMFAKALSAFRSYKGDSIEEEEYYET